MVEIITLSTPVLGINYSVVRRLVPKAVLGRWGVWTLILPYQQIEPVKVNRISQRSRRDSSTDALRQIELKLIIFNKIK